MRFLIIVFIFTISGCSGAFGTMDRVMSSWMGASLDEVIAQWGYPAAQQDIGGRKLYHWDRNASLMIPSHTTGAANIIGNTAYINTTTYGGGMSHWSCRRTLEVNADLIVVGWQWGGNNCPFATVGMGYENWARKAKLQNRSEPKEATWKDKVLVECIRPDGLKYTVEITLSSCESMGGKPDVMPERPSPSELIRE